MSREHSAKEEKLGICRAEHMHWPVEDSHFLQRTVYRKNHFSSPGTLRGKVKSTVGNQTSQY